MSLTAALHQEQLIAMISCLKKDNHLLQIYKWYITQFEWSIKGCIYTGFLQRVPNSGNHVHKQESPTYQICMDA